MDAPKDVRRLEALKPTNTPSMRERYDSSVSKEKRLEAATDPLVGSKKKGDAAKGKGEDKTNGKRKKAETVDEESDDEKFEEEEEQPKITKQPKSKKRKAAVINEADLKNVEALKEEDEVQEGIVWSDSESG